jgi:UDP-N-acetylmuramate--alanine ligase
MTYGFNAQADVRAINLTYTEGISHFDIALWDGRIISNCCLPMPGEHNVSNAIASVGVALHLGMSSEEIRFGLQSFKGVNRRFTKVAVINGITIIDDYAHHPVEILATLKAARQSHKGRILAIHQPHRYTRLDNLFEEFCTCFHDADVVGITDVFAAGEMPIKGAGREDLVSGLVRHGHRHTVSVENEEALAEFFSSQCRSGDMLVCLGAGSISTWAHKLASDVV